MAFSPDGKRIVTCRQSGTDRRGEGVGRGDGPGAPRPQGHTDGVTQRGVQPRRQAHRHRQRRTRRRRCGTPRRARKLLTLKGHTRRGAQRGVQPRRQAHRHRQRRTRRRRCGTPRRARNSSPSRGTQPTVFSVAFSPDGRRIVTGSQDQTAKVWDAATGQEAPHPQGARRLRAQRGVQPRRQDASSPAARTQTAKVWDAETGQELLTLKGHTGRCEQRGVQPRRQAHRHRQRGQDGEGVGRGDGPGDPHPQGAHQDVGRRAWRSAPTASASSPAARTRR